MARLIIREAVEADYAFIMDSWLSSHGESKIFSPFIPRELYFKLHRPVVEAILARPSTKTYIAANEEDPSLIYGYVVFEQPENFRVIHYVYVKRAFNGFGITKALVESLPFPMQGVFITHLTHKGRQIFKDSDFTYCFYFLYPVKIGA